MNGHGNPVVGPELAGSRVQAGNGAKVSRLVFGRKWGFWGSEGVKKSIIYPKKKQI